MTFEKKGEEVLSEIVSFRCTPAEKKLWNDAVNARKEKYNSAEDTRKLAMGMLKYCSSSLVNFFTGVKFS